MMASEPSGAIDDASLSNWRLFDPGYVVDHLPFRLTIGQTFSYSDNIQNLPSNFPTPRGISRGDTYSDTTIGASSTLPFGGQTFFFNGTYNPRRYIRNPGFNADNYSINGGVDFAILDRCTGRLVAGSTRFQAPFQDTAGFGINDVSSTSFNETARCGITNNIYGLLNTGISQNENSGLTGIVGVPSIGLNDYTQQYVSTGLEYSGIINTVGFQATFTNRDFTNRAGGPLGLARATEQDDYQFYLRRTLTAKLNVSGSIGISVFAIPGQSGTRTSNTYSLAVNYVPTPKIFASFAISRGVGAPQSIVADIQESDVQSVTVGYRYSPKLSFSTTLSHSTSNNPALSNVILPVIFQNSESKTASLVASYAASPLLTATAAYTYSERTAISQVTGKAVANVFRLGFFYTR